MQDGSFERKIGLRGGVRRGRPRIETRELRLHVKPSTCDALRAIALNRRSSMSKEVDDLVEAFLRKEARGAELGRGAINKKPHQVQAERV